MAVETMYNTSYTSPTNTGRQEYTDVGSSNFALYLEGEGGTAPIGFKDSTIAVYDVAVGGTALIKGTDYVTDIESVYHTARAGYSVKYRVRAITHQSGSIYIDCDIVAQETSAEVINELQSGITTNTSAISSLSSQSYTGVINTVHIGKRTSSLPDFLTYSGLYVGIDTNSGSDTLRLNVANGRSDTGLAATIINISADVAADGTAWTIPSTDGTYQLFIDESGTYSVGALDTFYTAGTIYPTSPSSGDNFFDINDNKMYSYTAAWAADQKTPVGEAIVSSSVISSVVCYAFNGIYMSNIFTLTSGSQASIDTNIGIDKSETTTYVREDSSYHWGNITGNLTTQISNTATNRGGVAMSNIRNNVLLYPASSAILIANIAFGQSTSTTNQNNASSNSTTVDCYIKTARSF